MADVAKTDLGIFAPLVTNDLSNNGGRMTETELLSGALEVTFGDVPEDERDSGSDKFRKIFAAVRSLNNGSAFSNKFWLHRPTPGDDWAILYEATNDDTQSTLVTTTPYGSAELASNVVAGATTIIVNVEDDSNNDIFRNTEKFIISNKLYPSSTTGSAEIRTSNAAPSVVGSQITLTFDDPLTADFAAGSFVSSILETGTIQAGAGTPVVTSTAGTFDSSSYPMKLDNKGSITETLTLNFTSSTAFTCSGTVSGAQSSSGDINTDYSPVNPDNGRNLITIYSTSFGGTFANGDTVEIPIVAASQGLFERRVIPSNAGSLSANQIVFGWSCESS